VDVRLIGGWVGDIASVGRVFDMTQLVKGRKNEYSDRNHGFQSVAAMMELEV
jgi:hypothetical protein